MAQPVQLWRFNPSRSARKAAHQVVLKDLRNSGWAWTTVRLRQYGMRYETFVPLVVALAISGPMFAYVGRQAGWVRDAWQVSAVLLGFVIALLIFLLQAVADRSLRSERTFRAVITGSRVAWPTWFTLVFIGWVAVIDRYSTSRSLPAPAWVTSWSLGFFIVGLVALVGMLSGVRRLLAPAGLTRVLERAIAPEIELGVEERLVTQTAMNLLVGAFGEAGVTVTPSFDGYPVPVSKDGEVDDIDLKLPRQLVKKELGESFNNLGATIGSEVSAGRSPIAEVSSLATPQALRVYRSAFRVRRHRRRRADWLPLFEDVTDMALRALAEGTVRDFDLATGVLLHALMTVPQAYRRFGVEYDYQSVRPIAWQLIEEDRALERLRSTTTDIAVSDRPDGLLHWAAFPYRLASAALQDNVLLLFDQALELWLTQVDTALLSSPEGTRNAVIQRVHSLSSSLSGEFVTDFESDNRSLAERELAMTRLQRMIWFRGQLMKRYVDAENVEAFMALLSELRTIHIDPKTTVLHLRRQQQIATAADDRGRISRELQIAERLATALDSCYEAFSWTRFRTGAWVAWKYRESLLSEEAWVAFSVQLADPFVDGTIADRLDSVGFARDEVSALGRWRDALQGIVPTVWVGEPPQTAMALFWTSLLLLRMTGYGSTPQLVSEVGFSYRQQLEDQLSYIEQDAARWESFVGEDVTAKAELIRAELRGAEARMLRQREERIAETPISAERVADCRERAQRAFERDGGIRAKLLSANALTVEADSQATSNLAPSVAPREEFVDGGRFDATVRGDRVGSGAAEWQERWLYREMVELGETLGLARDGGDDFRAATLDAIAELAASDAQPDTVLLPWGRLPNELFGSEFTFDPTTPSALGHVGIAEVFVVPMRTGEYAIVCDLARALLIREKELGDIAGKSLSIDVRDIVPARAAELVDAGQGQQGEGETRQEAIDSLCRIRVEVETVLACEVVGVHLNPAIRLIKLPPHPNADQAAVEEAEPEPAVLHEAADGVGRGSRTKAVIGWVRNWAVGEDGWWRPRR